MHVILYTMNSFNHKNNQTDNSTLAKISTFIAWFLGSWWGVLFHTAWFAFWILFDFDLGLLTFSVSLEAIFIGIFLLIVNNRSELKRDKKEYAVQKRESDLIEKMFDLVTKQEHRQQQIIRQLTEMEERLTNKHPRT